MGSSKSATVGYRYYMGLHFGVCHGPVDALHQITVGERSAWSGNQTASGAIGINAPELFGGDSREGGVYGVLDVMMGESTQPSNSYLAGLLGAGIPGFRGIMSAVWRGGQVASNNPYVKPWAFKVKRILQGWTGGTAWYPEKASILSATCGSASATGNYFVAGTSAYHNATDSLYPLPEGYGYVGSDYTASIDVIGENCLDARNAARGESATYLSASVIVADGYLYVIALSVESGPSSGRSAVQVYPECPSGYLPVIDYDVETGAVSVYCTLTGTLTYDMNPAHIIYQCITDSAWGMGYPTSAIDSTSFTAAADALYSEGFGLSMLWNRQEAIEDFVQIVLDHIGGMLYVDPATGKFALKLIRDDYVRETLPQYGPTNLISAEDYQRQLWGETVNEITVVYTAPCTGKETATTVQDTANIMTQGGIVAQTRSYTGITSASLAQRVALRDLNSASTPLARIKLTATRAAWEVFPGDVFRLTWPEYDISDVVYRVMSVNRGTLQDGQIIIDAVEDVFGLPDNTYLVDQPSEWEDPSNEPTPAPYRALIETPYWDLVRNLSEADMAYVDSLSGYVETLAVRPSSDAINYSVYTKVGTADYEQRGNGDFCPSATIVAALTKTMTAITLENGVDLDLVPVGGYAVIENEYVLVSAIDAVALTATISRGVLDTVPVDHTAGSRIWFADAFQGFETTEYADGETVDVKLLPITGRGELPLADAPVDSLTFDQRQYRPYAPGKLIVNSGIYPEWIDGLDELSISWAHRDRLSQTAYIVEQDESSIGPEAGVTYTLRIYNEEDSLARTVSGTSTTSYTYAEADELSDGGGLIVDTHWANVKTLLNMTGADGSTTFTDSASTPITWTSSGNAHIEVDQYKFGGSSGQFDGASDYLYGPASNAAFNLGAGDFSIDFWIRRSSGGAAIQSIIGVWGKNIGRTSWIVWTTPDGKACFSYSINGNYDPARSIQSSAGAIALDTWSFCEWSRSGTTMRLFVDGAVVLTHTCGTDTIYFTSTVPTIGSDDSGDHLSAFLQDLRLTKGSCRNTAAYTPPIYQAAHYTGDVRLNGRLRIELESVRGGLVSYQKHDQTVLREGYGFNYGYYYGGQ